MRIFLLIVNILFSVSLFAQNHNGGPGTDTAMGNCNEFDEKKIQLFQRVTKSYQQLPANLPELKLFSDFKDFIKK